MIDVAEIYIWGSFVGAVRWNDDSQHASFQFDNKFLEKSLDLAPIKMPLSQGPRIYSFPELRIDRNNQSATFNGLPGLLADSLPDKYGNQLINVWLAINGRPPNSMNPVEKLCFIGSRGMGALEFEPAHVKRSKNTFSVEIDSLVEIAGKMLSQREALTANFLLEDEKAMQEIIKIGTSAGGARPKAVIAYNKKTGEVRSGQTRVPSDFNHWLIKLDGVSEEQFGSSHGWGRVEYAYYKMALDCKIEIMESQLLEENGRAHFITRRFDRDANDTRHHIQTYCGIQHFDYNNVLSFSYEQLFQTMRILKLDYRDAEQMFRRMVFNVMASNCDDHTKNFSFRLKENGRWELSPAYDICFAYDDDNYWLNQHSLSINSKRKNITDSDLVTIARANNISNGQKIITEIREIVSDWSLYAEKAMVKTELKNRIDNRIKKVIQTLSAQAEI